MTILTHLHYLAVVVSALVYFGIGAIWFSPVLFSKPWMAGHGITMPTDEETRKKMMAKMPMYMLVNLIVCFIGVLGMGYLIAVTGKMEWMGGAKMGLLACLFIWISFGMSHMYTRKSFKTFLIDVGYHTVGLVAVGIILAVWH